MSDLEKPKGTREWPKDAPNVVALMQKWPKNCAEHARDNWDLGCIEKVWGSFKRDKANGGLERRVAFEKGLQFLAQNKFTMSVFSPEQLKGENKIHAGEIMFYHPLGKNTELAFSHTEIVNSGSGQEAVQKWSLNRNRAGWLWSVREWHSANVEQGEDFEALIPVFVNVAGRRVPVLTYGTWEVNERKEVIPDGEPSFTDTLVLMGKKRVGGKDGIVVIHERGDGSLRGTDGKTYELSAGKKTLRDLRHGERVHVTRPGDLLPGASTGIVCFCIRSGRFNPRVHDQGFKMERIDQGGKFAGMLHTSPWTSRLDSTTVRVVGGNRTGMNIILDREWLSKIAAAIPEQVAIELAGYSWGPDSLPRIGEETQKLIGRLVGDVLVPGNGEITVPNTKSAVGTEAQKYIASMREVTGQK